MSGVNIGGQQLLDLDFKVRRIAEEKHNRFKVGVDLDFLGVFLPHK